jgi:LPS-assembly lipoprotein
MLLGAIVPIAGCGFRPAFMRTASGRPGVASRELAAVTVGIIPDRPGQLLRQALQERFEQGGTGVPRRYDLAVAYGISGEGIAVQPDNSTTRIRLIGRADWTLTAQDPGRTALASGRARSVDDVNIIDQQYFAADLGNEAAQRRIADALADQITLQLAAWFRHRAGEGVPRV